MNNNMNELKLNLVHYFVKVEKYKAIQEKSNDYASYLVNSKNKFQIIRITIGSPVSTDPNLNELKDQLKISKRQKIDILNIIIAENDIDFEIEGQKVLVNSIQSAKTKLLVHFSKINTLSDIQQEEQDFNLEDMSVEELTEILTNPTKSSDIKLQKAAKSFNKKTPVSMVLSLIFFVMPITFLIIGLFVVGNPVTQIQKDYVNLIFGGTNRNLTIVSQQWWRVFTYGFTVSGSGLLLGLIEILIISSLTIKLSRYTETMVGTRNFAIAVLVTYPLTGFFISATIPGTVFSGPLGFLASVVGILGTTTWNKKKEPVMLFTKNRLVGPIFILAFFPIGIYSNIAMYALIVSSATIATVIYLLLSYDYKSKDKYLYILCFAISVLFFVPLILALIPTLYPALDTSSLYTLQFYNQIGLMSEDKINRIVENKLGWNFYLKNGIWIKY